MPISRDHPLRKLFRELVTRHFRDDPRIADYVCGLLLDFVHVDSLYRVRNSRGKLLEEVGEMLIESNPMLEARSFDYEREVRKHIGDYTLFLTGLFPEYVASLPRRGRLDSLVDYIKAGKESYGEYQTKRRCSAGFRTRSNSGCSGCIWSNRNWSVNSGSSTGLGGSS